MIHYSHNSQQSRKEKQQKSISTPFNDHFKFKVYIFDRSKQQVNKYKFTPSFNANDFPICKYEKASEIELKIKQLHSFHIVVLANNIKSVAYIYISIQFNYRPEKGNFLFHVWLHKSIEHNQHIVMVFMQKITPQNGVKLKCLVYFAFHVIKELYKH